MFGKMNSSYPQGRGPAGPGGCIPKGEVEYLLMVILGSYPCIPPEPPAGGSPGEHPQGEKMHSSWEDTGAPWGGGAGRGLTPTGYYHMVN